MFEDEQVSRCLTCVTFSVFFTITLQLADVSHVVSLSVCTDFLQSGKNVLSKEPTMFVKHCTHAFALVGEHHCHTPSQWWLAQRSL